jgi:hypothetical protein
MWSFAAALALLLLIAEARISNKDLKSLKKVGFPGLNKSNDKFIDDDSDLLEGSADYEDEEEDDYDDEDYEEGSGDDDDEVYEDEEATLIPDDETVPKSIGTDDDIHFDESFSSGTNSSDVLYEYYSEDYEPDYEDDKYDDEDDDEDDEDEDDSSNRVLYRAESDVVIAVDNVDEPAVTSSFQLSYLYIMLASAFVSFALAIAAFFLCRASGRADRSRNMKKKKGSPSHQAFVMPTAPINFSRQSPIVKDYQASVLFLKWMVLPAGQQAYD